ncbi:udp-glycosyltransferase 88b1, partial [Quercus suber]
PSLTIHILIAPAPYNAGSTTPYIASVSSTTPSSLFTISPVLLPLPPLLLTMKLSSLSSFTSTIPMSTNLSYLFPNHNVKALIMDFFCSYTLSVASNLNLPGYFFFTSGAAALSYFLYHPIIHKNTIKSLKDLNTLLFIPE